MQEAESFSADAESFGAEKIFEERDDDPLIQCVDGEYSHDWRYIDTPADEWILMGCRDCDGKMWFEPKEWVEGKQPKICDECKQLQKYCHCNYCDECGHNLDYLYGQECVDCEGCHHTRGGCCSCEVECNCVFEDENDAESFGAESLQARQKRGALEKEIAEENDWVIEVCKANIWEGDDSIKCPNCKDNLNADWHLRSWDLGNYYNWERLSDNEIKAALIRFPRGIACFQCGEVIQLYRNDNAVRGEDRLWTLPKSSKAESFGAEGSSDPYVKYEITNLDNWETMTIKLNRNPYVADRNTYLRVQNLETGETDQAVVLHNTDVPRHSNGDPYYKEGSKEHDDWLKGIVWKVGFEGDSGYPHDWDAEER
jgi:hypothetical protein